MNSKKSTQNARKKLTDKAKKKNRWKIELIPLKWESEASQLKFGEIVFATQDIKHQQKSPKAEDRKVARLEESEKLSDKLSGYDYVIARLAPSDRNFYEKALFLLSKGFALSDVFIIIKIKIPRLSDVDVYKWKDRKIITIESTNRPMLQELTQKMLEKMKISRYFQELPFQVAERIYTKWLNDIIERGLSFILLKEAGTHHKIEGFIGCTKEGVKCKNFILFGEGMSFILLIKSLANASLERKLKYFEFKISLRNHKAIRSILKWLENRDYKVRTEFVFSKLNLKEGP